MAPSSESIAQGADAAGSSEQELRELRAEVRLLRARVRQLEEEKADLLRANAERDYERPPHYR